MTTAADLARQLQAKRTGPGAWIAQCPAHDDNTASLSIGEGEAGRLLLNCFAGCAFPDILKAAGVDPAKPNGEARDRPGKARIVATYDYRDVHREVVFQVVRKAPKSFQQRRPDGDGGWIWGRGDTPPLPYRLPELIEASEVYIVEGEKDADRLAALGITATTNPGGADKDGEGGKKWPEGFGRYFDGRHAILIPDNDPSGQCHVQAVAKKLSGKAASIRILELPGLPAKGDVSDWIDAGGTAEQLRALADAAPYWEPSEASDEPTESPKGRIINLRDFAADRFIGEPPPVKWLIDGNIPLGCTSLLAAMGDTGKSYLALQLCHYVTRPTGGGNLDFNVPILGGQVAARGTAVFITSEDSEATVHRRLDVIDPDGLRHKQPGKLIVVALPDAGGPMPLFIRDRDGSVVTTPEWRMLYDQLLAIDDLTLVVFDPLAQFAHVSLDKDSTESSAVASSFGALAAKTGAAVLVTHHMRKDKDAPTTVSEARDRIRGSSGIVDGVRLAYALWPVEEAEGRKVCRTLDVNFAPNRVVKGAVVKANNHATREIATYVRSDAGLLVDRTDEMRARRPDMTSLYDALVEAVAAQAASGHPFTHHGGQGLHARRELLPDCLRRVGRDRLERLAADLLETKRLVKCIASGSTIAKWLDVPTGTFALGIGEIKLGASTAQEQIT